MKMRDLIDRLGEAVGQQPRQAPQPPKPPMPPGQEREEDDVDMLLKSNEYQSSEGDPKRFIPGQQGRKVSDNDLTKDFISSVNRDGTRTWKSKKNPNGRKFTTDQDGNITIAEGAVARQFHQLYKRDFFDYAWDGGMTYRISDPYQVDLNTFELYDHGGDPLDPEVEPGDPNDLYRFVLVAEYDNENKFWFVPLVGNEGDALLDPVLDRMQLEFEKVVGARKR